LLDLDSAGTYLACKMARSFHTALLGLFTLKKGSKEKKKKR